MKATHQIIKVDYVSRQGWVELEEWGLKRREKVKKKAVAKSPHLCKMCVYVRKRVN